MVRKRVQPKLWYVVQVDTGSDRRVASDIRRKVLIEDCSKVVGRVMTPVRLEKSTRQPPYAPAPTLAEGTEVTMHDALRAGRAKAWELAGEPAEPRANPDGYRVRVVPSKGKEKGKVGNWWTWRVSKPGPRRGRERVVDTEALAYPGYVILHMRMTDFGYDLVRSVRGVVDFLRTSGNPTALESEEAARLLLEQADVHKQKEAGKVVKLAYGIGDQVLITDGPFAKLTGKVERVTGDAKDPLVRVLATIIGRVVPVELSHRHCQKV